MPTEPASGEEVRELDDALARLTREQLLSVLHSHATALPAWDRARLIEQMKRTADGQALSTERKSQGVLVPMLFGMLGIAIATAVALLYLMSVRTRPAPVESPAPQVPAFVTTPADGGATVLPAGVPSAATDAMLAAPDSW